MNTTTTTTSSTFTAPTASTSTSGTSFGVTHTPTTRVVETFTFRDPILTTEELRAGFSEERVKCLNQAARLKCVALRISDQREQHDVFTGLLVDLLVHLREKKMNRFYQQQRQAQWQWQHEQAARQRQEEHYLEQVRQYQRRQQQEEQEQRRERYRQQQQQLQQRQQQQQQ